MMRYAVLDNNGKVINVINVDDPIPQGYWPGYGASLLPSGVPSGTANSVLPVLTVTPSQLPQIGDVVNKQTGAVFRYVPSKINVDGQDVMTAPKQEFKDER